MDEPDARIRRPCPGALGAFGVPARRWRTRVDLFDQMEAARKYLDSTPVDELSIGTAASEAGLSEFHFIRLFGEVVGQTPSDYITERRLTHAAELLKGTSKSVQEIALDCGYQNPSAFSRAFRRRFGVTPLGHRKAE
jgi:AraC family transcriptional regulator